MNEDTQVRLTMAYRGVIDHLTSEMTCTEKGIIKDPNLGTVQDGVKAYYAKHLRILASKLLTSYYSVKDMTKWNEFKQYIKNTIDKENNVRSHRPKAETVAKIWAHNHVLHSMEIEEWYNELPES